MNILKILFISIFFIACSKNSEAPKEYNKNLTGKVFTKSHSTLYDKYIEFFKSDSIRVSIKDNSGNVFNIIPIETYKYEIIGNTGINIQIDFKGDANFSPKKIQGIITGDILSFSDYPLEGTYNLKK